MAKLTSPYAKLVIANHQHQGQTNDCGPYSAAMVINAFCRERVNPAELARSMDHLRWNGVIPVIRRIPNWATFPWGLVDVLRQAGMRARWRPFANPSLLVRLLQEGTVPLIIIGGWRPLWGHVMVLLARDQDRGWGFANPATTDHEIFWMPDALFLHQWRAFGSLVISATPTHPASG